MILSAFLHRLTRWAPLLVLGICYPDTALSNPTSPTGSSPSGSGGQRETTRFGIEGHYRVGCWTGVRADTSYTSIETRDGDGVQVSYRQPAPVAASQWGYVIPGSEAAPVVLRDETEVVVTTRFPTIGSPSRGPAMIPRTTPWIVVFGDPLGIDRIGANALLNRDPTIAVSIPSDAGAIPDSVLGYDGVDMMLIGGSSIELLRSLNQQQQQAIVDWVRHGGRLFLTLGESAPRLLQAAPWLPALLPLDQLNTTKIDPSALETYTSTQTPLQSFVGSRLPKDQGKVLILGRTSRRVSTPVAVDYVVGFGRITVVAADLEQELFATWPERLDLITELTETVLIPDQDEQRQPKPRATAYDDLAGQLRLTLDQFAIKRKFGFSVLSLLLMALIAAVGPLDYLLINRLLGRPLLGWLSFPLMAIGLSVLLAAQSRPATPGTANGQTSPESLMQCNRIEIFDIDSLEGIGRGFAVSYLYGHAAHRFDLDVVSDESLSAVSDGRGQMMTVPFGYPGTSFGGIQIEIEDARLPVYQVTMDGIGTAQSGFRTSLEGLPLAARSSKGIATHCRFTPEHVKQVSLEHRPGSELLQGELVNPLPFDLLEGMLVYRNWAYLLPTRFPAGGRIEDVSSLRQKNFRWRLSRQQALESATETEAWNPAMSNSPDRVAEILMFHNAVGGKRYTGLRNDPLSFLDISHVLAEDRCMLVGRLAQPFTSIEASGRPSPPAGDSLTLVRVVLPVHKR